jgi:bacillithiol biosynthesis deacetylase BshB1
MLDILAFGAHPDDVEFCCAGTMILMRQEGCRTGVVDLTRGELGTNGTPRTRAREAAAAAKIMGLAVRENLGIPDGDVAMTKSNVMKVVAAIRRHKPRIVLVSFETDRHPDHAHSSQLVREAAFYAGLEKLVTRDKGKKQTPHRPQLTLMYRHSTYMEPSIVIDITAVWEKRIKALMAFSTQVHNPKGTQRETFISRPGFLDYIEARAQENGFLIGAKYGEAFNHIGPLWNGDLRTLIPETPRHV